MALTPEQIQQLINGFQGMSPAALSQSGGMYRDPSTGQGIHANYGAGGYDSGAGDYVAGAPTEYMVSAPGATRAASSPFDRYSPGGEYTGTSNYTPATDIEKQLLKYGIALAGVGAAGGMFGGGLGGAGGASVSPGATGGFNAAMDSQLANLALGDSALAGYGAAGAGGITASPIAASAGNSLTSTLTSLLPEGAKGWLGPAATIAGGLLGSKPQTQSATTTRTTDPRFDPAINGLLGMLQAQIGQTPAKSTLGNITPASNPFTRKR